MKMRTVTFYSYKGGAGRSLTLSNFARFLALAGKRVLCIDLDIEAPGLHYKFGVQDKVEGGVVDLLLAATQLPAGSINGEAFPDPTRFVVTVPVGESSRGTIHLLPAGRAPSAAYWRQLGQVPWTQLFYSDYSTSVGPLLFMELKARLAVEYEPDFILVDSRTGITEISGVATTVLCNSLVCFVVNNQENWDGARAVLRSIRNVPRPPGIPGPVTFTVVMPRIPRTAGDPAERELTADLKRFFNEPADVLENTLNIDDVLVIHSEPDLELDEHAIMMTATSDKTTGVAREYFQLFSRIAD